MAIKEFTQVRVQQPLYKELAAEVKKQTPRPTITHLANVLIAEALAARRNKAQA